MANTGASQTELKLPPGYRTGRRPAISWEGCPDLNCLATLCRVCCEEADTLQHNLLRCPFLSGIRLCTLGCIYAPPPDLQNGRHHVRGRGLVCLFRGTVNIKQL